MNKSILTIASGKKLYLDLAINLYYSFILNKLNTDINFIIVTDIIFDKKELITQDQLTIKTLPKGELGVGFSSKLQLDFLAPEGQTLFIDSDCLIFGDLTNIFERFKGQSVSVVGSYISDGEWFGDIRKILIKFGLNRMPKFNGGIYYLEKGEKATRVYQLAREIEQQYEEIGFKRLRNRPNDEVIMALAMAKLDEKPLIDDGTIMSDPLCCQAPYRLDVIKGIASLENPHHPNKLHQPWYPFHKVSPKIVHFLGYYTEHYPYQKEVFRLKKKINDDLTILNELRAIIFIEARNKIKIRLKNLVRPIYRAIFGIRNVRQSNRI